MRCVVAWLLVMVAARVGLSSAFLYDDAMKSRHGNSPRIDFDTNDFMDNVEANPRFSDTLKWWSGPWFPKVPYYRPLTMTLFWGERHLFGAQGRPAFQWTHRLAHLGFLTLLLVFFVHVAGWKRGTLGVILFASTANRWLFLPVGDDAFNCWKDQCDMISIALTTLACLLFWRGAQGESARWWRRKWWWGALACMIVGITIKEGGFLVPLYALITLWCAKRVRALWPAVIPFFALALGGWMFRWWALGGWGNRTGGGGGWPVRFAGQVLGLPISLISGDGLPLIALCLFVCAALLVWWRVEWEQKVSSPRAPRLMVLLLPVAAWGWWKTFTFLPGSTTGDNFSRITTSIVWQDGALLGFFVGGFFLSAVLWRRGERAMLFGWLWVFVGFLPLIFQPPTSPHVHYPIAPGWSLWLACFALWVFEFAARKTRIGFEPQNRKDALLQTT